MRYEVRSDREIRGPYTLDEVAKLLATADGPLSVRIVGTSAWHHPAHYSELRSALPTYRPPPCETGTFSPVTPVKTIARVRAPYGAPRLYAALRRG